ncbi:MAG: phosphoadenylyl-sulfate reductase [Bacteroidota bacterium]
MTKHIKRKYNFRGLEVSYSIEELNALFTPLSFKERLERLYDFYKEPEILYTSSFGTKSIFLLHLLHQIRPTQAVHFIDTGYNFPETIAYKTQVQNLLDLNIIEVHPQKEEHALTREGAWWEDHPKMCCSINKIVPLNPIVAQHKIWISGLMSYQTDFRSRLRVFEQQGDIIKFHPLIDIDEGEFLYHLSYYKLPRHPLEAEGYGSVGCTHCTVKGEGRDGRWKGKEKTECGLHPNYFNRK